MQSSSTIGDDVFKGNGDQDADMIDTTPPPMQMQLKGSSTFGLSALDLTRSFSVNRNVVERTQQEGGIIAELFFGQLHSFCHYKQTSGEDKFQEVREAFNEVMISAIDTKNFYEAWENMYQSTIDDYQTPEVT